MLIVDDHAAGRAIARFAAEEAGLDVIHEAVDGQAALTAATAHSPDAVLSDIRLPGLDGIALAEHLARQETPPCVILTSLGDATGHGERLAHAPTRGFIRKDQWTGRALVRLLDDRSA